MYAALDASPTLRRCKLKQPRLQARTDRENAMAFVPASNTLQVEIRGTYFGQDYENVLYFKNGSTIDSAEVETLFDFLEDDFLPFMMIGLSDQLQIDELYGTDLTTSSSPTYSRIFIPAIEGTESGAAGQPGSVAACISFRSANRGRGSRGRNYVSGITENNVSGNTLDAGQISLLVAAYELLLGGGDIPASWVWSIVSRFLLGSPRVSALVQEVLDVLSTDITVDSQRGRLRGD